eukprot:Nk52_evm30s223 gene=Nk52_evmTU30s223
MATAKTESLTIGRVEVLPLCKGGREERKEEKKEEEDEKEIEMEGEDLRREGVYQSQSPELEGGEMHGSSEGKTVLERGIDQCSITMGIKYHPNEGRRQEKEHLPKSPENSCSATSKGMFASLGAPLNNCTSYYNRSPFKVSFRQLPRVFRKAQENIERRLKFNANDSKATGLNLLTPGAKEQRGKNFVSSSISSVNLCSERERVKHLPITFMKNNNTKNRLMNLKRSSSMPIKSTSSLVVEDQKRPSVLEKKSGGRCELEGSPTLSRMKRPKAHVISKSTLRANGMRSVAFGKSRSFHEPSFLKESARRRKEIMQKVKDATLNLSPCWDDENNSEFSSATSSTYELLNKPEPSLYFAHSDSTDSIASGTAFNYPDALDGIGDEGNGIFDEDDSWEFEERVLEIAWLQAGTEMKIVAREALTKSKGKSPLAKKELTTFK